MTDYYYQSVAVDDELAGLFVPQEGGLFLRKGERLRVDVLPGSDKRTPDGVSVDGLYLKEPLWLELVAIKEDGEQVVGHKHAPITVLEPCVFCAGVPRGALFMEMRIGSDCITAGTIKDVKMAKCDEDCLLCQYRTGKA